MTAINHVVLTMMMNSDEIRQYLSIWDQIGLLSRIVVTGAHVRQSTGVAVYRSYHILAAV